MKHLTPEELRHEAKKLNREKKYKQAVKYYAHLYPEYGQMQDGLEYAFCLMQIKKYTQALNICRLLYAQNPNYKNTALLYAQSIYYSQIKTDKIHKADFFKAAKAVLKLCKPDEAYSPYNKTVLRVIDYLKKNDPKNTELQFKWIQQIKPETLSEKQYGYKAPNGKTIRQASEYESYALACARICFARAEYMQVLKFIADIEQQDIIRTSNYYIWIIRLKAKALHQTGNSNEAARIYQKLIIRKPDWFLKTEYADILLTLDIPEKALCMLTQINPDKLPEYGFAPWHKLTLKALKRLNNNRLRNDWQNLNSADMQKTDRLKNAVLTQGKIILERITGRYCKPAGKTCYTGQILKILPGGKAGFIKYQKRKTIFFSIFDIKNAPKTLAEGTSVQFETAEAFDKKKNKKSLKAVAITIIND